MEEKTSLSVSTFAMIEDSDSQHRDIPHTATLLRSPSVVNQGRGVGCEITDGRSRVQHVAVSAPRECDKLAAGIATPSPPLPSFDAQHRSIDV